MMTGCDGRTNGFFAYLSHSTLLTRELHALKKVKLLHISHFNNLVHGQLVELLVGCLHMASEDIRTESLGGGGVI